MLPAQGRRRSSSLSKAAATADEVGATVDAVGATADEVSATADEAGAAAALQPFSSDGHHGQQDRPFSAGRQTSTGKKSIGAPLEISLSQCFIGCTIVAIVCVLVSWPWLLWSLHLGLRSCAELLITLPQSFCWSYTQHFCTAFVAVSFEGGTLTSLAQFQSVHGFGLKIGNASFVCAKHLSCI